MPEENFLTNTPLQPTIPVVPPQPQGPVFPSMNEIQPELEKKEVPIPKRRSPFIFILLLLFLIAFAGAGYYGFLYYKEVSKPSPTPTTEPTPVATTDPTADWKTYTDKDNKYSFKFPSDFEISDYSEGDSKGVQIILLGAQQVRTQSELADGLVIKTLVIKNSSRDAKALAEETREKTLDSPLEIKISEIESLQLNEKTVYKYKASGYGNSIDHFLDLDSKTVLRIMVNYSDTNSDNYLTFSNQIISTFKFINQETDTSNWKTYTNSEVGFSFKYPNTVKINEENTKESDTIVLAVGAEKVNELVDDSGFMERTTALADRESLKKGEYGKNLGVGTDKLKTVRNIDGINGKTYISLIGLSCDEIYFFRGLVLYKGDYQIGLSLSAPVAKVVSENPKYFGDGSSTCGINTPIWNLDLLDTFIQDLSNREVSSTLLTWFDTFDQILSTFKFTN